MKKTTGFFISIVLIISLTPYRTFSEGQSSSVKRNLRVLTLEGTPYRRGFQHGKSLKKDIHALVDLWKADIEKKHKIDPDVFIKKFLEYTDFPAAIRRWTPELLEEVRGIADGSGQKYETIFAFQLVDEMWVLGSEMLASTHSTNHDRCTTIGVQKSPRASSMVSQTLDIPAFYHGFQTLLLIKEPDSDFQTMLFTFPGFIAANGINSSAVAVVVNAVPQLEHSRKGLPVAFVIRGILQKKTYQEAVRFIRAVEFGAPQNYMIGGQENVGSFECSAFHVEKFLPFIDARFTYHTNHPLKNRHFTKEIRERFKSRNIDPLEHTFKCPRFEALQRILKNNDVEIGIEKLKDIYRSRETFINNPITFGTTIMVLSENPELHISPGRPDEEPFQVFRFR